MRFDFTIADDEARQFCERVLAELMRLYQMPEAEAVARMNEHWRGRTIGGPNEVVYHEDETFWAQAIYYRGEIPRDQDLRFR